MATNLCSLCLHRPLAKLLRPNSFEAVKRLVHTSGGSNLQKNSESQQIANVFDRKAKFFQRERAAQLPNVSDFDYFKEEMGYRLADRVLDISRDIETAVDISCGRGFVTRHLTKIKKLYALEMSPSTLEQCQMPPPEESISCETVNFDEDNHRLPFPDNSISLVTSSLAAHWINNLPGFFSEVKRILKNDGVFIGSMFGGETLFELRCALQMAELEREGGFGSHISPFVEVQDLGSLLNRSGFNMLTIDSDEIVVKFPTIFQLMRDLKGMAENNATWTRKPHLHRDTLLAANAIYSELYGDRNDNSLPATFQVYFWIGWKPDISQPKPLKPQTSDISLKDIYKLDEVIKEKKTKK